MIITREANKNYNIMYKGENIYGKKLSGLV